MKRKSETSEFIVSKKAKTIWESIALEKAREVTLKNFLNWTKECFNKDLKNTTVFSKVSVDELRDALPDFTSIKAFVNRLIYRKYNQAMEYLLSNLFGDKSYFKKIIQNIDDLIELLEMVHSPQARPCRVAFYKKLDFPVIEMLINKEPHKKEALIACINQIQPSLKRKQCPQHSLLFNPEPQLPTYPSSMQNQQHPIQMGVTPTMQTVQNQHAFFPSTQASHFYQSRPRFNQITHANVPQLPSFSSFYSFSPNANVIKDANKRQTVVMPAITELTEDDLALLDKQYFR